MVILLLATTGLAIWSLNLPPPTAKGGVDFTLPKAGGGKVTLHEYRGKVVLIDFMATWCVPCQAAFPQMVDVYATYRSRGVVFISVDADPADGPNLQQFAAKYNATWVLAMDTEGVHAEWGVTALPRYFILDRSGQVVASATGDLGPAGTSAIEEMVKKGLASGG